jgi:DNA-directed RNA polymerase specialized sigma24 family protein
MSIELTPRRCMVLTLVLLEDIDHATAARFLGIEPDKVAKLAEAYLAECERVINAATSGTRPKTEVR